MNFRQFQFDLFLRHFAAAHWRWRCLHGQRLTQYQAEKAEAAARFAWLHSPFYRRWWAGWDIRRWQQLPAVDKAAMMANFDQFNTRGVRRAAALAVALAAEEDRNFAPTLDGLTVGLSSGTSGHRGLFLISAEEQAAWAGVILARALHELAAGSIRVAFFLRSYSNLYAAAGGLFIQLRYLDLMTPLADAAAALNALQPHLVVAPPSLLGMLAAAQSAGRLHIRPLRLLAVAEVLEPQDRAQIADCFQAPVHQIYQCTEGLLAVTCPHGSLHLQEDIVAVQCEPLAPPGPLDTAETAPGRVTPIITDLWRRTQPIVRYRLNDVLQLDARPCACGSDWRVLAAIEGRQDDILYFLTDEGKRRPFFPDTIRRMILLAHDGIADYQAVQEQDGHLRIHLETAAELSFDAVARAVRARVEAVTAGYGCRCPQLEIEKGLEPVPPGAKRRRVQRQQRAPIAGSQP